LINVVQIETVGQDPHELFAASIDILIAKCKALKDEIIRKDMGEDLTQE
jgi:hypothetical protein